MNNPRPRSLLTDNYYSETTTIRLAYSWGTHHNLSLWGSERARRVPNTPRSIFFQAICWACMCVADEAHLRTKFGVVITDSSFELRYVRVDKKHMFADATPTIPMGVNPPLFT